MTAAIKTAVLATDKPGIVAFEGGYHGLGYAPLAACGYHPRVIEINDAAVTELRRVSAMQSQS